MISTLGILALALMVIYLSVLVGVFAERRRVASALRQLPIYQEEFEYYLDRLGLDDNPLDRRSLGEE